MRKNILLYSWGSVCEPMAINAFEELEYEVIVMKKELKDYHADAEFARECMELIHKKKPDMVFSYDYFPMLSMICQINKLPYVSWIYDCPMYTLLSKTIGNDCNYIFCFDEKYTEYLYELGAKNVCHFPLATDLKLYERADKTKEQEYACNISFVGNLYNNSKNRLLSAELEEYEKGYTEGIIAAQQKVYGYNLVKDSLNETIVEKIIKSCNLMLNDTYLWDSVQMAADTISTEITSRERQKVFEVLSNEFEVTLYTTSEVPAYLQGKKNLFIKESVNYNSEMPLVFHNSKINLNITSKTIETGIPQRVLDILACKGFCLTNYQKEIADFFEDGKELVMYSSMEDLLMKAEYYLEHEEERKEIAKAGYEKICAYFGIRTRIAELLECINL